MRVEPWMWGAFGLVGWLAAVRASGHVIASLSRAGRWDEAIRASRRWEWLVGRYAQAARLALLGYSGRVGEALAIAEKFRATPMRTYDRNVLVNSLITAGRYGSALEVRPSADGGPSRSSR